MEVQNPAITFIYPFFKNSYSLTCQQANTGFFKNKNENKNKNLPFLIKEHWSEGNPKWYCGVGTDLETLLTNLGGKKRSGYFDMGPSIYYVSKGLVGGSKSCQFCIHADLTPWVAQSIYTHFSTSSGRPDNFLRSGT